jgi:hypothetical protein
MPDWLTHTLAGWITGKTIKLEISLVVIGSLIPDIFKLYLGFDWLLKSETQQVFLPIHTPIGAMLITIVIAGLFPDIKKALLPLGIGVATHFILDFLLINVSVGIPLLFPFSWEEWQLNLIRSDDYLITIFAIIIAVAVYILFALYDQRKSKQKKPL